MGLKRYVHFSVQSEAYHADYLEQCVDTFVEHEALSLLKEMTAEQLDELLHSEFAQALWVPSTAAEESKWIWEHVENREHNWEYRRLFAETFRKVTHASLVQWYGIHVSQSGGTAARLVVRGEGGASTASHRDAAVPPADHIPADGIEAWKETMLTKP